jgi:hypothetical protein
MVFHFPVQKQIVICIDFDQSSTDPSLLPFAIESTPERSRQAIPNQNCRVVVHKLAAEFSTSLRFHMSVALRHQHLQLLVGYALAFEPNMASLSHHSVDQTASPTS